MKRVVLLAMLACAAGIFWAASASLGGQGEKPRPEAEFAPRVLMIHFKEPVKGTALGDVRVRQLGNRTFLVGKVLVKDPENPRDISWSKATHWVALDSVSQMFEFSNVEEARKVYTDADQMK